MAFKRIDELDTSTLICPCGASFTWSGYDAGKSRWMDLHSTCKGPSMSKLPTLWVVVNEDPDGIDIDYAYQEQALADERAAEVNAWHRENKTFTYRVAREYLPATEAVSKERVREIVAILYGHAQLGGADAIVMLEELLES